MWFVAIAMGNAISSPNRSHLFVFISLGNSFSNGDHSLLLPTSFFFFFPGCICGMWKLLGWVRTQTTAATQVCSENAETLTHCATRELHLLLTFLSPGEVSGVCFVLFL